MGDSQNCYHKIWSIENTDHHDHPIVIHVKGVFSKLKQNDPSQPHALEYTDYISAEG